MSKTLMNFEVNQFLKLEYNLIYTSMKNFNIFKFNKKVWDLYIQGFIYRSRLLGELEPYNERFKGYIYVHRW